MLKGTSRKNIRQNSRVNSEISILNIIDHGTSAHRLKESKYCFNLRF